MRRPIRKFGCLTAVALLLAGCAVNIEATDLSKVAVENERSVIEQALGKPDEVFEAQNFTVAAYTYDKGYYSEARAPTGISRPASTAGGGLAGLGWLIITAVAAPIDHAARTSEARPQQQAKMAVIYVGEGLAYAGLLVEPDRGVETLKAILEDYKASQTGDADALFRLSEISVIPSQRQMFLLSAAENGNADAHYRLGDKYRYGNDVKRELDTAKSWFTKAMHADHADAKTALSQLHLSEERYKALLERAEDEGIEILMHAADVHRFGNGVPKDVDLSIWLYERAVLKRKDFGAYALGKIYADGETGTVNLIRSYMWFSIGENIATSGKGEFAKLRQGISSGMNSEQIGEAERMTREWLTAHPQ